MTTVRQTQPWQRRDRPLLSNCPSAQAWCRALFYCPRVIFAQGKFRMWFVGCAEPAINYACSSIGYAESDDGYEWQLWPNNPVVHSGQVPWHTVILSTPWVLFDEVRNLYEMWCATAGPVTDLHPDGYARNVKLQLAYATSRDGVHWQFHGVPLLDNVRAPCVRKENSMYRMWINDRPDANSDYASSFAHVYEYQSVDGIEWTRHTCPSVVAGGNTSTCVYPSVLKVGGRWYMWHIGHLKQTDGPPFEVFCDVSYDGSTWKINHTVPAYVASRDPNRFDHRFISTPCVVEHGNELRLYHAASNPELLT